jgi:hypothetical protein
MTIARVTSFMKAISVYKEDSVQISIREVGSQATVRTMWCSRRDAL